MSVENTVSSVESDIVPANGQENLEMTRSSSRNSTNSKDKTDETEKNEPQTDLKSSESKEIEEKSPSEEGKDKQDESNNKENEIITIKDSEEDPKETSMNDSTDEMKSGDKLDVASETSNQTEQEKDTSVTSVTDDVTSNVFQQKEIDFVPVAEENKTMDGNDFDEVFPKEEEGNDWDSPVTPHPIPALIKVKDINSLLSAEKPTKTSPKMKTVKSSTPKTQGIIKEKSCKCSFKVNKHIFTLFGRF